MVSVPRNKTLVQFCQSQTACIKGASFFSCRKYGGHCWRNVGLYEYKVGSVLRSLGRPAEAAEHLEAGCRILAATHGRGHRLVARAGEALAGARGEAARGES